MIERHTVDFDRFGINLLRNAERGTIWLHFDTSECLVQEMGPVLKAIDRRFGRGLWGRLSRWMTGRGRPTLLASSSSAHPENPEVIRVEMTIKDGERMDSVLAALMDLFRQQPGYCRTLGPPWISMTWSGEVEVRRAMPRDRRKRR
jgi:hypothetical protein